MAAPLVAVFTQFARLVRRIFGALLGRFSFFGKNGPALAGFTKDLTRFGTKVGAEADTLTQKVDLLVEGLFQTIRARTPVDTGRAKAGWTLVRHGGGGEAGRIEWEITNDVPYVLYLEYGWSRQAPRGMVRISIEEFRARLRGHLGAVRVSGRGFGDWYGAGEEVTFAGGLS